MGLGLLSLEVTMPTSRSAQRILHRAIAALTLGVIGCTSTEVTGPSRDLRASFSAISTVPSTTGFDMVDIGIGAYPTAINPSGAVVGGSKMPDGQYRGFLWRDGKMIDLGSLGGGWGEATGISPSGDVVGRSTTAQDESHAFIWRDGAMRDLGTLGAGSESGNSSYAAAINPSGSVVGQSTTADNQARAVLWRDGRPLDLGTLGGSSSTATAIDAAGEVAGASDTPDSYMAFLWKKGTMTGLGSLGGWSGATGVANGYVVGNSVTTSGSVHAFLWHDGVMRDLGTLGGTNSFAFGVNVSGWVVGTSEMQSEDYTLHAFLWRDGHMIDLGTLPGGVASYATAISPSGRIVGSSYATDGAHAVMWTPK